MLNALMWLPGERRHSGWGVMDARRGQCTTA